MINNRDDSLAFNGVWYIKQFIGLPYIWGGDDTIKGFDCSGLAVEMLQACGKIKSDLSAHSLYQKYKLNKSDIGKIGMLVFYGSENKVTHVGICINDKLMLEAGGGGRKVNNLEAAAKYNAYIRMRSIYYRSDFVCFCDPFEMKDN